MHIYPMHELKEEAIVIEQKTKGILGKSAACHKIYTFQNCSFFLTYQTVPSRPSSEPPSTRWALHTYTYTLEIRFNWKGNSFFMFVLMGFYFFWMLSYGD
jgi:hypothetical protein